MRKFALPIFLILIILSSCERHELTPIPDEHAIIFDRTLMVNALIVDINNTKWIGTSNGLYAINDAGLVPIDTITFGKVRSLLYEENTNQLWIGTDNGLFKAVINNIDLSSDIQIPDENLSNNHIRCAFIDSSEKKWFGTDLGMTLNVEEKWKNDSFRFNALGRIFPMKTEIIGINSIASFKGDIFFATEGSSMWRGFDYNDTIDAFSGATQWVSPYNGRNMTSILNVVFVDSKDQLWMGGRNGIQVYSGDDPAAISNYTYYDTDLPDSIINVIAEAPDGNIWVGTEKGLAIQEGTLWTAVIEELPDINVTSVAFDKIDGSKWIGTKKGILKLK